MPLDPLSRLILKWCAVLLLVVAVWFHGNGQGAARWEGKYDGEKAAHQKTREDQASVLQGLADLTEKARQEARGRAQAYASSTADNDSKHKKEMAHALAAKDRVIDDWRSGRLRLHDWWFQAPGTPPTLSGSANAGTPTFAGRDVEYAELRAASLAEGVQDGALADVWIGQLQRELIATRVACSAPLVVK
ncbi:lysis system i-spanin subunit Rz [Pseudoxanthomonas indica]|uniref:lysis system i-spanin subunit Rz n=1 Tax=Pseudoxanthomonas indica TaxID=428993 RepID=UPI0009A62C6B|nr:lysis system i-spanin subunit Rz [Pseudoxanthomonas indica]GGD57925.1 hypothetical protein GCM10007235_32720 [Pseudoxanthomonas indica]